LFSRSSHTSTIAHTQEECCAQCWAAGAAKCALAVFSGNKSTSTKARCNPKGTGEMCCWLKTAAEVQRGSTDCEGCLSCAPKRKVGIEAAAGEGSAGGAGSRAPNFPEASSCPAGHACLHLSNQMPHPGQDIASADCILAVRAFATGKVLHGVPFSVGHLGEAMCISVFSSA
jgi:hypothetical protein